MRLRATVEGSIWLHKYVQCACYTDPLHHTWNRISDEERRLTFRSRNRASNRESIFDQPRREIHQSKPSIYQVAGVPTVGKYRIRVRRPFLGRAGLRPLLLLPFYVRLKPRSILLLTLHSCVRSSCHTLHISCIPSVISGGYTVIQQTMISEVSNIDPALSNISYLRIPALSKAELTKYKERRTKGTGGKRVICVFLINY